MSVSETTSMCLAKKAQNASKSLTLQRNAPSDCDLVME